MWRQARVAVFEQHMIEVDLPLFGGRRLLLRLREFGAAAKLLGGAHLLQRAVEGALGLREIALDFGEALVVGGRDEGGESFVGGGFAEGLFEIEVFDALSASETPHRVGEQQGELALGGSGGFVLIEERFFEFFEAAGGLTPDVPRAGGVSCRWASATVNFCSRGTSARKAVKADLWTLWCQAWTETLAA